MFSSFSDKFVFFQFAEISELNPQTWFFFLFSVSKNSGLTSSQKQRYLRKSAESAKTHKESFLYFKGGEADDENITKGTRPKNDERVHSSLAKLRQSYFLLCFFTASFIVCFFEIQICQRTTSPMLSDQFAKIKYSI